MRAKSLAVIVTGMVACWSVHERPAYGGEPVQYDLHIERQSLSQALQALAKQSGIQIIFFSKVTDGHEAPALNGRFTTTAALERLLSTSGLTFREINSKTIEIRAPNIGAAAKPPNGHDEPAEGSVTRGASREPAALEEVIVTAQKRTEKQQDVPASISVLSGQQIESFRATQLADYAAYVPGLTVTGGGTPGQVSLTLRGLSALGPTTQVATYIDETPVGSSAAWARESSLSLDLMPYDIERAEILRGPQGTLYGSNSMGGLLKYVLHAPDLNRFSAQVGADVSTIRGAGEAGYENVRGVLNAPLMDGKLALRVSALHQQTPGYIDNPLARRRDENALKQDGARVAVLWRATEDIAIKLQGVIQRIDSENNASVRRDLDIANGPGHYQPLAPSEGDLTYSHPLAQPFRKEIQYYAATINWNLALGTLTAASSYSKLQTRQAADFSDTFGSAIPLFTDGAVPVGHSLFTTDLGLHRFTQEVRLASPSGPRLEWLLGTYYSNESSTNHQVATAWDAQNMFVPGLDPLGIADLPSTYQEVAAFANTTYRVTNRFFVTAGVRWARNRQSFHQYSAGALAGGVFDQVGRSKENVTTYALSPQLHISDAVMLYARLASGYRPGGPNVVFPGVPPQNNADHTTNFEVGLKSELLDRRALLNLTAYRIDWRDMQLNAVFGGVGAVVNGKTARSQGLELESAYSVIKGLRLNFTAAYTDARITADMLQPPAIDWRDGDRLPYAPKWSAAFLVSEERPLTARWIGSLNGGLRYTGAQFNAVEGDKLNTRLASYAVVDMAAGVADERWRIRVYAKNLLDRRAYSSDNIITDILNTPLYVVSQVIQPRTVGLAIDVNF